MRLLFISEWDKADLWRDALQAELPALEFRLWPDEAEPRDGIDYALVWKPPSGVLRTFPNLKAILSLGAGIDGILCDPELPDGVPVSRLVDRCLTQGMTEYVVYWTIHYHRRLGEYAAEMADGRWRNFLQADTEQRRVGILGLGELGRDSARALRSLNFRVLGWSRTPKAIDGVECFHGPGGLSDMVSQSEILVCLLPLTAETEGILDHGLFAQLPDGSFLINCVRGGHLVEDDLIPALESGKLAGATLDVFREEPLPADHPFWAHPKVVMTPHMASLTVPSSAAAYIADNIRRVERSEAPLNVIDPEAGY